MSKINRFEDFKQMENYVNRSSNSTGSLTNWFETTSSTQSGINNTIFNNNNKHPPVPARKISTRDKNHSPSEEQKVIVESVISGKNVIVDSVFGSGKTTCILQICKNQTDKNTMILTYNAKLKLETKDKCSKLGLSNVEIHSYHALAVKYYYNKGNTDKGIQEILDKNLPLRCKSKIQLIILDEQQDMTPLYFHLVKKFINDIKVENMQYVFLGDNYQNIYSYKGSDSRFLTMVDKLFESEREWIRLCMSLSFRTTDPIRNFINRYLVGYDRVKSKKSEEKLRYLLIDSFSDSPFLEVQNYLSAGYKPDDIYILAPSLRTAKSPARILENKLSSEGIPCFVPVSDTDELKNELIAGKIVFSSFHQIKGSERPVVIVFNFDASYFTYYAKDCSTYVCPNPIYVALSRATERMSLIHHYENDYFTQYDANHRPRLENNLLGRDPNISYIKIKNLSYSKKTFKNDRVQDTPVTDLLRHLDYRVIDNCLEYVSIDKLQQGGKHLNIPLQIETKSKQYENISEINGIAIPTLFELKYKNHCSILTRIIENAEKLPKNHYSKVLEIRKKLASKVSLELPEIMYLANIYNSIVSGYNSKREQIQTYDWLKEKYADRAISRLEKYINSKAIFEVELSEEIMGRKIIGQIDIIQHNKITELWELKCVKQLEDVHIIQLAVYGWLYKCRYGKDFELKLFNILNNEILQISISDKIVDMVQYIVKARYNSETHSLSDDEFVHQMKNIKSNSKNSNVSKSKQLLTDTQCCLLEESDSE